jgi:SAM-dependent methyltransferase
MDGRAMDPHGLALAAHFAGKHEAQLTVRRDDGVESVLPVGYFFRAPDEFTPIECAALDRCEGHVLDVGAGSGLHSLVLQARGITVTAIDISEAAVEIMKQSGVRDAYCADVFQFTAGPFDTLLLLGHGIGMVEDLSGLHRFLIHAHNLTAVGGRLLVHSLDVRQTDDPVHLAYHETNRGAGRYVGETRLQFEYDDHVGPFCGWLHVDPRALQQEADSTSWGCEVVLEQEGGDYLACLTDME